MCLWTGPFLLLLTVSNIGHSSVFLILYFSIALKGVAYIHSRQVVHLDLSLENLLLSDSNEIKIIDFGQAQFIKYEKDAKGMIKPTKFHGIRPGKPQYQDPEICRGAPFDGVKADIWSCGVMIFIILFARPPYTNAHPSDRLFQNLIQGKLRTIYPDYNRAMRRNVTKEAADLISGMCAAAPRRYTMEQILAHPWFKGCDVIDKYQ